MTLKCNIYTLVYLAKLLPNQSDFYYCGIIESGVFAAKDVAEGIADEVGVADCQVGDMMGMAVDPCRDSTGGNVVAEFGCIGGI